MLWADRFPARSLHREIPQEGLHNLSVSLHTVRRDRDKPPETKAIFTGYIAGPLVARSEPALLPLLPPQELQTSSAGGRWDQMGSRGASEVRMARFGSCFFCFPAQQRANLTPPGQPSAAGQHAVNQSPKPHGTDLTMERTLWPHEQITHTEAFRQGN